MPKKIITKEDFENWSMVRRQMSLPLKLDDLLEYQESVIRNDAKRSSTFVGGGCVSRKKHTVDNQFMAAFGSMSKQQQTEYYVNIVRYLDCYTKGQDIPQDLDTQLPQNSYFITLQVREGTFRSSWTEYKVQLVVSECKVKYAQKEHSVIDLHHYLVRKSKVTDRFGFVLECIKASTKKSIRIGFQTEREFEYAYNLVKIVANKAHRENVSAQIAPYLEGRHSMLKAEESPSKAFLPQPATGVPKYDAPRMGQIVAEQLMPPPLPDVSDIMRRSKASNKRVSLNDKTIVEELLDEQQPSTLKRNQQLNEIHRRMSVQSQQSSEGEEQLEEVKRKKNLDIFHRLFQDYNIEQFHEMTRFKLLSFNGSAQHKIYRGSDNPRVYRLTMQLLGSCKDILSVIVDLPCYKLWNQEVELGDIKIRISSENSAIVYQKHQPYSKLYRSRDYLYIRHVFCEKGCIYVADKSIDNFNFPPHTNIIRGQINYAIWSIRKIPNSTENKCVVNVQLDMEHGGYLTTEQQRILTMRYLQGILGLEKYMTTFHKTSIKLENYFDMDWDIQKNESNLFEMQLRNKKNEEPLNRTLKYQHHDDFDSCASQLLDESFHTAQGADDWSGCGDNNNFKNQPPVLFEEQQFEPELPQVEPKELQMEAHNFKSEVDCDLDPATGHALLPVAYLNKRHKMSPVTVSSYLALQIPNGLHHFWKDEWDILPEGALTFIHLKKTEEQKKVLQYVIKKLGKNLLSGKGVLNVSLPVDIFGTDSNLQRTARAMGLGPKFLEQACKTKDPVERIKYVMIFGLGNGLTCVDMEKPFNPILGETYQGWLNGCPVFCEQVSHHPPITAFYLQGRGYKVYGNIEARVELGINAGCGINYGQYVVEFDDNKQKVRFRTPGGEISGLTYGQRKFNFRGKGFYHDFENCLYGQLIFNPGKKWFGKQEKLADCVEGSIMKVSPSFLEEFRRMTDKEGPKEKDIVSSLVKIGGRWTKNLLFDGKEYYNVDRDVPCIIEQEMFPLNSNSNYREDIIYRKKRDFARSQMEKERLENVQRGDRKLREKKHGKAH